MRRRILLIIGLTLATASPLGAASFTRAPIAPDLGLDALTRGVARDRVGRDLFSNPYATVTISNVDVYDRFPYLEARHFEIVSDPGWNRLVCGEPGRSLRAYDGRGTALGPLSEPRGMAVDERNRLYVADTGNDRIVVLEAVTEFDRIDLIPRFAIGGLSGPYDVAYSDGGTPFAEGDDFLYVADTGKNRVAAFALSATGARMVSTLGELGSGSGRFAGPMAIAAGSADGAATGDLYVADAHNRRIVHLRNERGSLRWIEEAGDGADVVTSLATDRWGNLYAAAPQQGLVRKFSPGLVPVAELRGAVSRPRSFHVPSFIVHDHRDGTVRRVIQPSALSVDQWSEASGVRLWNLGVGIERLAVTGGAVRVARFTLTDRAAVTLEVADASSGRRISRRTIGALPAGVHEVPLVADDLRGAAGPGDLVLRLSAASSYADGASDAAQATFRASGGATMPSRAMLLESWPNPTQGPSRIAFLVPPSTAGKAAFGVFDATGRRVRSFDGPLTDGWNEISWDGTDAHGRRVPTGLYFYRLDVGGARFTRRIVVIR